jgi:asparagine synthase (glutamine-hydrolysing)
MCGIAGIVGDVDAALLRRMLDAMRHRGPDDLGTFVTDGAALGQTRLSIIDVPGGHQPILNEAGDAAIVANGEIYNFRALAKGLGRHELRTRSDSEIPLHLYEDDGPGIAGRLEGMFAFGIWDGERLFLARDPVGIKPLYYAIEGDTFYFASEIKGLLAATDRIREFPNGHTYRADRGFEPFAEWPLDTDEDVAEADAIDRARRLLRTAVHAQLVSDVPLGTLCSGGLDSTIVTALAAQEIQGLHTFSTGMAGARDLERASRAAEALGTVHHVREFTEEEALRALPAIAWHLESFDAALLRSAVPTYFVSELARRYVKVVLTGEGADELYAGYAYLAELPDGATLRSELVRITRALHHVNLQRTDRMTMAHSLEGRVPFLDWAHVRFALRLPTRLTVRDPDRMGKWLLRAAFRGTVPDDILGRRKEKFAEGAGSAGLLRVEAERHIADAEFEREASRAPVPLRTKEELFAYRLFEERFSLPPEVVRDLVGTTAVY